MLIFSLFSFGHFWPLSATFGHSWPLNMAGHFLKHPTQCIGTYFYGQNDIFEVFEVFEGFSFFLPIIRLEDIQVKLMEKKERNESTP